MIRNIGIWDRIITFRDSPMFLASAMTPPRQNFNGHAGSSRGSSGPFETLPVLSEFFYFMTSILTWKTAECSSLSFCARSQIAPREFLRPYFFPTIRPVLEKISYGILVQFRPPGVTGTIRNSESTLRPARQPHRTSQAHKPKQKANHNTGSK